MTPWLARLKYRVEYVKLTEDFRVEDDIEQALILIEKLQAEIKKLKEPPGACL